MQILRRLWRRGGFCRGVAIALVGAVGSVLLALLVGVLFKFGVVGPMTHHLISRVFVYTGLALAAFGVLCLWSAIRNGEY